MSRAISHLRISFDVLSLFGISSTSPCRSRKNSIKWRTWTFVVLICQLVCLFNTIFYRNYYLRSELSPVGMLFNLIHYTWMMCTATVLIVQSLITERDQSNYWTRLEKLRELRFQDEEDDGRFLRKVSWTFITVAALVVFVHVSVIFLIVYDPQWMKYFLIGLLSVLVIRMFFLKVYLFVALLRVEVNAFERHLKGLVAMSRGRNALKDIHISLALEWHSAIIDASRFCNKLFNYSLFFLFVDSFIMLGSNFYWAYIHLICRKSVYSAVSEYKKSSHCSWFFSNFL